MLFVFPAARKHTVWMLDTSIPLDIVWLDQAGPIVETACGQPYSLRRLGGRIQAGTSWSCARAAFFRTAWPSGKR